jgi:FkbM family methyltransferase
MYSQFEEQEVIENYFKDYNKGLLIDIGANDGITFSNSLGMIEKGWDAICVEPTFEAFQRLENLHKERNNVFCVNCAITEKQGDNVILVNGSHYNNDVGLLSVVCGENFDVETPIPNDVYNWKRYEKIKTESFETLVEKYNLRVIDLICIDAEGYDYNILKQIDLNKYDVKMVIVETDNSDELHKKYDDYFNQYGFKRHHKTIVNIIYTK